MTSSSLLAMGCTAKFNKASLSQVLNPKAAATSNPGQSFIREVAGANNVASSAGYKLKSVSIGGITNHNTSSANYKGKDAATAVAQ